MASQILTISKVLAVSMMNHPRVVNSMPVTVEAKRASPGVSTKPQTATPPRQRQGNEQQRILEHSLSVILWFGCRAVLTEKGIELIEPGLAPVG